nr:winged helix-turn-helix domain-containing protein [Streptomyces sp. SID8374]
MAAADEARLTFERIADDLRQQIRDGELRPGQLLPTQSQLMQTYKSSSLTVQKAIRLLRNEGWVIARQGRGTFVTRSADFEDAFEKVAGDLTQQIYSGTLAPGSRPATSWRSTMRCRSTWSPMPSPCWPVTSSCVTPVSCPATRSTYATGTTTASPPSSPTAAWSARSETDHWPGAPRSPGTRWLTRSAATRNPPTRP